MITETESLIKHYLNSTKGGFIRVGQLLKQILQAQEYKELGFTSFENYADSPKFYEKFKMNSRNAFNFIKVFDAFGSELHLLQSLPITKLLQIAYVSDRIERANLLEKAPGLSSIELTEEIKSSRIKRLSSNISEEVTEPVEKEIKCLRLGETILEQLTGLKSAFKRDMCYLRDGINKWNKFSEKYPENKHIQDIKKTIEEELKE